MGGRTSLVESWGVGGVLEAGGIKGGGDVGDGRGVKGSKRHVVAEAGSSGMKIVKVSSTLGSMVGLEGGRIGGSRGRRGRRGWEGAGIGKVEELLDVASGKEGQTV
jgi:hypothetical protein